MTVGDLFELVQKLPDEMRLSVLPDVAKTPMNEARPVRLAVERGDQLILVVPTLSDAEWMANLVEILVSATGDDKDMVALRRERIESFAAAVVHHFRAWLVAMGSPEAPRNETVLAYLADRQTFATRKL